MSTISKKLLAPNTKNMKEKESTGTKPQPFASSVKGNALSQVKGGLVIKKESQKTNNKLVDEKSCQTEHPDVALVTGDEPPLEYWKLLAEERLKDYDQARKEILELKAENASWKDKYSALTVKNELLENEIEALETIAEEAGRMAEMIQNLPDDQQPYSEVERDQDQ